MPLQKYADRPDFDDASPEPSLSDARWVKLSELVQIFGNSVTALAGAVDRDADYIEQYLKGRRHVEDRLANHIERKLDLPVGWLSDKDKVCCVIRTVAIELRPEDQDAILAFVETRFRTYVEQSMDPAKSARIRIMLDRAKADRDTMPLRDSAE